MSDTPLLRYFQSLAYGHLMETVISDLGLRPFGVISDQ